MGWCLGCHRNPAPYLRPKDEVTTMGYRPPNDSNAKRSGLSPAATEDTLAVAQGGTTGGPVERVDYDVHPGTNCTTCHR